MKIHGPGSLTKQTLLVFALLAGVPPMGAAPAAAPKLGAAETPPLVEAFQKGPIVINAKVTRSLGGTEQAVVPARRSTSG
jgi:hypothetical protein